MTSTNLWTRTGALFPLSLLLFGGAALAQTDGSVIERQSRGFYVGGGAGANFQEPNNFQNGGTNSRAHYDPGYVGILSGGYAFGNGLRVELEPGYRYNDLDKVGGAGGRGRTQIFTAMANAIYDFDIHTPVVPLVPHIGAGVGWAHLWNNSAPHNGLLVKGQDDAPAFQAIAGVEYAWSPSIKLGLDYRYLLAHDAQFRVNPSGATSHVGDFNDHAVLVTFRYEFGAPRAPAPEPVAVVPPPPPPVAAQPAAPAEAPATLPRNYTVYFDFDRSDLTQGAAQILERAASDAKRGEVTRITVTGYADRVGAAAYNQRLSKRRAETVRDDLVRRGVSADEIVVAGRGENELAVPTANGVREPRNRRVEIVLQGPGV